MLSIDFAILNFIQTYLANPLCDFLMPLISLAGDYGAIWFLLAAILLLSKKYRWLGLAVLLAIVLDALIINSLLKNLVGRARPCETTASLLVACPKGFSFPSGHAASSFAAALVLAVNRFKCWPLFLLLAALIGFSRLYLYVHFPSDVIAGAMVGALIGISASYLLSGLRRQRNG